MYFYFHSIYSKGLVQETMFVNCPFVICLPSMISLWRDTTSELWTLVLFFPLLNNHNSSSVYFSAIYFLQTIQHPHNTVNSLCSAKPVRLTTSLNSVGKVSWLFVCRFPCCYDAGGGALPLSVSNTFRSDAFLLLVDKPWYLNRGKLAAMLITPSSWGSQQCNQHQLHAQETPSIFLAPLHTSTTVSVLCCNAHIKSHSNILICIRLYSVN